jgi:hypothetical protein
MQADRAAVLAPSAKRRANRLERDDRARDRVVATRIRELEAGRRLAEVESRAVRTRVLGRAFGGVGREQLDPGYRPGISEVARLEREGLPVALPTVEQCSPVEPAGTVTCGKPLPLAGGADTSVRERYQLLDDLRRMSPKRTSRCRRYRTAPSVQVTVTDGRVQISGLETCGSIHACPVCAHKIYAKRAAELDSMLAQWIGDLRTAEDLGAERIPPQTAQAGLLTLTIRHGYGDKLADTQHGVAQAWRLVFAGRAGQRLKRDLNLAHFARALEVTHGQHGWHPHLHVICLFRAAPSAEAIARLAECWADAVAIAMGESHRPELETGCKLTEIWKASDGRYVAKMGLEVSGGIDTKAASHGNRTYWQLAKDAAKGDRRAEVLWREATKALHGSRQLTWSRGTRGRFGLGDLDDEQLAHDETEPATVDDTPPDVRPLHPLSLEVTGSRWDDGCRRDRRFVSRVVGAAAAGAISGDWSTVLALVKREPSSSTLGGAELWSDSITLSSGAATYCSQTSRPCSTNCSAINPG